jgi:hypothetical protein
MATVNDRRRPNWFWVYNIVIDDHGPKLRPIGIATYAALARHANDKGECWPCVNTIAREIHASPRAVQRAIQALVECKLLTVQHRTSNNGDYTSNLYTLLEPKSPSFQSSLILGSPLNDVPDTTPGDCVTPGGDYLTPPPPRDLWRTTLEQLKLQMSRATFTTWFAGTAAERAGDTLTIYLPNIYARDWCLHRLHQLITRNVHAVYGAPLTCTYEVRPPSQLPLSTNTESEEDHGT